MSKGLCMAHGGTRKCKHVSGCVNSVASKGFCVGHGGEKPRCKHASGCGKRPQGKGGLCRAHAREKVDVAQDVEI